LDHIERVAQGPEKSKGLHLIEVSPQKIEGFIRMQGGKYGKGKICHFSLENIQDLQDVLSDVEEKTQVIDLFAADEWGGVNDLHLLSDGRIGVLGHLARLTQDETGQEKKEYFTTSAIFDPQTQTISNLKIIMTPQDLGIEYEAKRPDLEKVLYPTNSVLEGDVLHIYASLGDTKPIVFTIENPWK